MVAPGTSFDTEVVIALALTSAATLTSFCVILLLYKCFCGRHAKASGSADDVLSSIRRRDDDSLERLRHNSTRSSSTPVASRRSDVKQLRKHSVCNKRWIPVVERARLGSIGLSPVAEVEFVRKNIQPEVGTCSNGITSPHRRLDEETRSPATGNESGKGVDSPLLSNTSDAEIIDDNRDTVDREAVVRELSQGCRIQLIISYQRTQETLSVTVDKLYGLHSLINCNHYKTNLVADTPVTTATTTAATATTAAAAAQSSSGRRSDYSATDAGGSAAPNTDTTADYYAAGTDHKFRSLTAYVGLNVLPDKDKCLVTSAKKIQNAIVWNESFSFGGYREQQLFSRSLQLQVFQYDQFSRNEPIGHSLIPLCHLDVSSSSSLTLVRCIQPGPVQAGKLGELLVSLCFQPTIGRITVVIIKARQLVIRDNKRSIDPYVKVWLLNNGKKVEKRRTTVKERTSNPVFNESFVFNLPSDRVRLTSLTICVVDHRTLGQSHVIGQVILGNRSGPSEVKHWNEVMEKARQPIAQWHRLKTQ